MSPKSAKRYRVDANGCWVWTGPLDNHGYGHAWHESRKTKAHRAFYMVLVGDIPAGLTIDHLCRNRACVNPSHLEPVTLEENTRRGISPAAQNSRKTHCIRGHEFTDADVKQDNGRTVRRCRVCHRQHNRESRQRKILAAAGVHLGVEGVAA